MDTVFQIRNDPDLHDMGNLLQEKMTRQPMENDVVPLQVLQQRRTEESNESFLAGSKPIENRWRIVDRPHQLQFGNIKLLRRLENDFP